MKTIARCSAVLLATSLLACSRPAVQPATAPRVSNNLQTDEVDSGPVDAGRPEAIAAPLAATSPPAGSETSPVDSSSSGAAAAPPASTGGTAAVSSTEQRLCDSLRRAASPLVEDTPNGARLWLKPRGTTDRVT